MQIKALSIETPRQGIPKGLKGISDSSSYNINDKLGEGASGAVFHAERISKKNQNDRMECAIKVFSPLLRIVKNEKHLEDIRSRFLEEATRAKHLNHKNICSIIELGKIDGPPGIADNPWADAPFYSMPFVKGRSLDRLFDKAPVDLPQRIRWSHDICEAIKYLHDNGLMHRDIKPANVLIPEGSSDLSAILVDYGVVKWGDFCKEYSQGLLTGTKEVLTTWNYLPPEVEVDSSNYSSRSEIWSLGKTILELCRWEIVPRIRLFTEDIHLGALSTDFMDGQIRSTLSSNPKKRVSIDTLISDLKDYYNFVTQVENLGNENYELLPKHKLNKYNVGANKLSFRDFVSFNEFHHSGIIDEDDLPGKACPKCGAHTITHYKTEYARDPRDEFDYHYFICLGTRDNKCGHIWGIAEDGE